MQVNGPYRNYFIAQGIAMIMIHFLDPTLWAQKTPVDQIKVLFSWVLIMSVIWLMCIFADCWTIEIDYKDSELWTVKRVFRTWEEAAAAAAKVKPVWEIAASTEDAKTLVTLIKENNPLN